VSTSSVPDSRLPVSASRRGGILLAGVLIFCILLLSAQAPAPKQRGSLLQSWILTVSAPVAMAGSAVSRTIAGAADSVADMFSARAENTLLKEAMARKDKELFRLRAEVSQAANERRLLEGGSALPDVLGAAPVLLLESRAGAQSALVGAGSSSGVLPGSPIAVSEGLVGRVVAVGRSMSRAQLLLDASAAVGARIVRTQELGVVRGDGRGEMRLNNIPTSSRVQAGDLVESAGIDGIYPRGVPIGRVAAVARGSNLFLEIRVTPAARFSQLTDVLLLAPSPAAGASGGGPKNGGP
jgi:rod shape-determining protein MreC